MTLFSIRNRLEQLIQSEYGRVEEEPLASGLVDSLGAIQLALAIEHEFKVPSNVISLDDLKSLNSLCNVIHERLCHTAQA